MYVHCFVVLTMKHHSSANSLPQGIHWVLLAVGFGAFGFTLAAISGISLSYLMDCYQDVCVPKYSISLRYLKGCRELIQPRITGYRRCPSRCDLHAKHHFRHCPLCSYPLGRGYGYSEPSYNLCSRRVSSLHAPRSPSYLGEKGTGCDGGKL